MALDMEASHKANVSQGLLSFGHGLNTFLAPKYTLCPRIYSKPTTNNSVSDITHCAGNSLDQIGRERNYKIPRKLDGFSKGKRSPTARYQPRSPLASPKASYSMSPTKSQSRYTKDQESKGSDAQRTRSRRKGSVPDPLVNAMTTVQEYQMDSPTIPGHPPSQSSSRGSPDFGGRKSPTSTASGSLTPRALNIVPTLKPLEDNVEACTSSADDDPEEKRKSLPRSLKPLVIPSHDLCILPAKAYRKSDSQDEDGPPPQVPPKSPRTINRAITQSSKATPTSANSSTTTLNTTSTSATSVGTPEDITTFKPWSPPIRSDSRAVHQRGFSAGNDRASPPPWSGKELRASPSRQFRLETVIDEKSTSQSSTALRAKKSPAVSTPGTPGHQRWASETSVMNRGRPTRRGETSLQRMSPKVAASKFQMEEKYGELPAGVNDDVALSAIPLEELRSLRKRAKVSTKDYKILRASEVADFSQELCILDERCQYLRETYNSLRDGRRSLQTRIIEFLNAPRTATFTTENIVKQEDALAELDASIDEWTFRLERAQDRRNAIRQKLLEHTSAVLMLKPLGTSRPQVSDEAQTPPRSPTKVDRSFSNERRLVESIKVYADSGVASLLASIEKDLGMMGDYTEMEM